MRGVDPAALSFDLAAAVALKDNIIKGIIIKGIIGGFTSLCIVMLVLAACTTARPPAPTALRTPDQVAIGGRSFCGYALNAMVKRVKVMPMN